MSSVRVSSRSALAELVWRMDQAGLHHRAVLVRAAMTGELCLVELLRDGIPSLKEIERTGRPALIIVGDDDYASTGPAGWAAVRKLSYWARGAMIHASGADAPSYQMAVRAAAKCGRFVLIETAAEHADQWRDTLLKAPRRIPVTCVLPANGVHPMMPEVVQ